MSERSKRVISSELLSGPGASHEVLALAREVEALEQRLGIAELVAESLLAVRAKVAKLEADNARLESERDTARIATGDAFAAARRCGEKRVAELEAILSECGTHDICRDTCGVCGLHFAECEDVLLAVAVDEEDEKREIPHGRMFACPGAKARAALGVAFEKGGTP